MLDNAQFHFRFGQCHAMALALHRRTGLPLGIIVAECGERDAPRTEPCRPVVMVGPSSYFDVDGYHGSIDAVMLGTEHRVHAVRLRPAGVDEVSRFFDEKGVDPEMVRLAEEFAETDATLRAHLACFRAVDRRA